MELYRDRSTVFLSLAFECDCEGVGSPRGSRHLGIEISSSVAISTFLRKGDLMVSLQLSCRLRDVKI